MIDPNRLLISLFVGLVVLDLVLSLVSGMQLDEMFYVPAIIPIIVALSGRGGKFWYYASLASSWLLASFIALLPLLLFYYAMDEAVESYDEPIEFFGLVMVFVIGALGVSSYFCITRTHPLGRITEVQRKLRILFNKLLLSLAIVFASNIALIISCHLGSWSFVEVMWVYWLESIIIGLFTAITICNLNRFDAIDINDTAGKSDEEIKRSVAGFFLMHYGGFHAAYLVAILAITKTPSWINILYILALSVLFAYSHYQKYRLRLPELRARRPKLGNMYARPYLRILPMHLTIILGFGFFEAHALATLILFILLKIIVDVIIEIGGYRQVKALAMSDA